MAHGSCLLPLAPQPLSRSRTPTCAGGCASAGVVGLLLDRRLNGALDSYRQHLRSGQPDIRVHDSYVPCFWCLAVWHSVCSLS